MNNVIKIKKFLNEQKIDGVIFGDENYHYARQISNSRFGHMPAGVAYCKTGADVQQCVDFCRNEEISFRIRSGGHHHEGMSSKSDALIIDLSEMYKAEIQDDNGKPITKDSTEAWIPPGMKLEVVYDELAKLNKVIPGGGCQSVNIGGLTQGGGWGTHIRKFGLTCDSLLEVEMVKANGDLINTEKMPEGEKKKLLWALRGGGGGNFGVVTKFKFALSELGKVRSTFTIEWTSDEETIKNAVKCWTKMHVDGDLADDLSSSASMSVAPVKKDFCESKIIARVAGRFYGEQDELLTILMKRFEGILPLTNDRKPLMKDDVSKPKNYFTSWNRTPEKAKSERKGIDASNDFEMLDEAYVSEAAENQFLTDFISGESDLSMGSESQKVAAKSGGMNGNPCDRPFTVLPLAPPSTCDAPHPHKVTSAFPSKIVKHNELIDAIYQKLNSTKYFTDVRQYMVWHCLGGIMTEQRLKDNSSFGFRDKPYMLQLQCWWNNSGHLDNDRDRATEYVDWVNKFRANLENDKMIEGAFINFVDRQVPVKEYYGANYDELQTIKKAYDPTNFFGFPMGIALK